MNPAFLITVHKISEQLSEMVRVSDVSGHCSKIDFVLFNKLKNKISERIEEVWNFDSY